MNTVTTVTGLDIRSDHYRDVKPLQLSRKRREVMDAALLAHAQGRRDFTNNELCLILEGQLGRRVSPSDITNPINNLISAGLLAANYHHGRACSVTGSTKVRTLSVVAQQAELGLLRPAADIPASVKALGKASSGAAAPKPVADGSRVSGMPPEVRARLAAIRQAAVEAGNVGVSQ